MGWRCIAEASPGVAVCVGRKNLSVDISSVVQMVRDCRDWRERFALSANAHSCDETA